MTISRLFFSLILAGMLWSYALNCQPETIEATASELHCSLKDLKDSPEKLANLTSLLATKLRALIDNDFMQSLKEHDPNLATYIKIWLNEAKHFSVREQAVSKRLKELDKVPAIDPNKAWLLRESRILRKEIFKKLNDLLNQLLVDVVAKKATGRPQRPDLFIYLSPKDQDGLRAMLLEVSTE